jgi:ABC-type dipeptide/oligopeptide/nickel transport system permease subunit
MPEQVAPLAISGVEAMRGIGAVQARGFWADAWSRVLRNRPALFAIAWIGTVALCAVLAPLVANANPLVLVELDGEGREVGWSSPLWQSLTATDLLMVGGLLLVGLWLIVPSKLPRSERLGAAVVAAVIAMVTVIFAAFAADWLDEPGRTGWTSALAEWIASPTHVLRRAVVALALGLPVATIATLIPFVLSRKLRVTFVCIALAAASLAAGSRWQPRPVDYDKFVLDEAAGRIRCTYTLIPWSPDRLRSELIIVAPGMTVAEAIAAKEAASVRESERFAAALLDARAKGDADQALRVEDDMAQVARQRASLQREWKPLLASEFATRRFLLGTDPNGADVLAQLLWACRLSISVGFVSTGIAVVIGVTMGSIMGYFGGAIDLLLFRVVEVFMAVPVLFLLIVAAGVLPRSTYVMMAIIGCLSWTGAARFTRAEFMKLRHQDFVQGARAAGLPLSSVLFRHMLPNGVTPVLVDASFAVAGAIIAEATLSYLGLGPDSQASWGKLLSSATGTTGTFVWWLAIFPGVAIFFSVLAYNILGGALRDAIDPKLRKAAH